MKSTLLIVAMLCSVILAACGPADNQQPSTPTPTETPTPAAPTPVAPTTSADRADFLKAMAGRATAEFRVNYDLSTQANGKPFTGTIVQYVKAPSQVRTDTTAAGVETRTYINDKTITICFQSSGSWSCSNMQAGNQESPDPTKDISKAAADESYVTVRDGNKQVAGVTADCYKVTKEESTSRYCIYDSVPLYVMTSHGSGSTELSATSYTKTVAAGDFTPPASAGSTGMPSGYTMPEGDHMQK